MQLSTSSRPSRADRSSASQSQRHLEVPEQAGHRDMVEQRRCVGSFQPLIWRSAEVRLHPCQAAHRRLPEAMTVGSSPRPARKKRPGPARRRRMLPPLLANIALAVLDEHVHGPSLEGGTIGAPRRRARRRAKGLQNWRIARYADEFVILVHGTRDDAKTLHDDIALVLEPLGLRLPRPGPRWRTWTTRFEFLGCRVRRKRKRGTGKWCVCTLHRHPAVDPVAEGEDPCPDPRDIAAESACTAGEWRTATIACLVGMISQTCGSGRATTQPSIWPKRPQSMERSSGLCLLADSRLGLDTIDSVMVNRSPMLATRVCRRLSAPGLAALRQLYQQAADMGDGYALGMLVRLLEPARVISIKLSGWR